MSVQTTGQCPTEDRHAALSLFTKGRLIPCLEGQGNRAFVKSGGAVGIAFVFNIKYNEDEASKGA